MVISYNHSSPHPSLVAYMTRYYVIFLAFSFFATTLTAKIQNIQAFFKAVQEGDIQGIHDALKAGTAINSKDNKGNTALHIAASCFQPDVVKILVHEYKADIHMQNMLKCTPLQSCVLATDILHTIAGKEALVEKLSQITQTIRVLIKMGAILYPKENINGTRMPPPYEIIRIASDHPAAIQTSYLEILDEFIKNGFDPNWSSPNPSHGYESAGTTLLHYAARFGANQCIDYLLSKGADIEKENDYQETPLLVAASMLYQFSTFNFGLESDFLLSWEIIELRSTLKKTILNLLDHGSNINKQRSDGNTLLNLVAQAATETPATEVKNEMLEFANLLITRKADVKLKNKQGIVPEKLLFQAKQEAT